MNVTISEDDLKDIIEKLKLDLLKYIKPEHNWLYKIPEKHRKFAAYWDELGRPSVEYFCNLKHKWLDCYAGFPSWMISADYRIKDDPHWELRLKWVNSGKTLPIEIYDTYDKKWREALRPSWFRSSDYREAKPWYDQEISRERPIFLRHKLIKPSLFYTFSETPPDKDNWAPLTDQEIDALKRGF